VNLSFEFFFSYLFIKISDYVIKFYENRFVYVPELPCPYRINEGEDGRSEQALKP